MDKKKLAERLIQQSKSKADKTASKITNEIICEEFNIGKDKLAGLKKDPEVLALIQELSQDQVAIGDFKNLKDQAFETAKKLLEQIRSNPADNHKQFESVIKYINEEEKRRGPETSQDQEDANLALLEHGFTPEVLSSLMDDPAFGAFCVTHKEQLEAFAKDLGWNSGLASSSGQKTS